MSSKTWTSQADWYGWSSRSFAGKQIDFITTVNSLTLCAYTFLDDMESGMNGTIPTNSYSAGIAGKVFYDNAQAFSGVLSIKTVGSAGDNYIQVFPTTTVTARTMECYYYQTGAPTGNKMILLMLINAAGNSVVGLGVGTNGHYYYSDKNSTWTDSTIVCTNTTWHRLKISYDSVGNTAKGWADGTLLGSWGSTQTAKSLGGFELTENLSTSQTTWFDNLKVWEAYVTADNVYPTTYSNSPATINYQYDAGGQSRWNSLSFTATKPTNTNVRFRFKTAATQAGLAAATYSGYYTVSGSSFTDVTNNRWVEMEIELSSTDTSVTSQLDDVTLDYTVLGSTRITGMRIS